MDLPHTLRIHHPSGLLYEAFRVFSGDHEEASPFQSDGFFELLCRWPGAEPLLLVALKRSLPVVQEVEQDGEEESLFPGGALRFRGGPQREEPAEPDLEGPGGPGPGQADGPEPAPSDAHAPLHIPGIGHITGSLLALTLREGGGLKGWRSTRTVAVCGPLLGEGTRLDRETCLRVLLNALQENVKRNSPVTHLLYAKDWGPLRSVFAERGFRASDPSDEKKRALLPSDMLRQLFSPGLAAEGRPGGRVPEGGRRPQTHPPETAPHPSLDTFHHLQQVNRPLHYMLSVR
jgi:hypothetical protein